jgi:hypothetical protein
MYLDTPDTRHKTEAKLSDLFPNDVDAPPRRDDASPLHGLALAIAVSAVIYAVIAEILHLTAW